MAQFSVISSDFVNVQISTSKDDISFVEKRFPKSLSISDLKEKLELITGGDSNTMQLEVYSKNNSLVCRLDSNDSLLGSFPIDDGMRLHVIDKFVMKSEMEFANVPKFELSNDEYSTKTDTVRAFLMKNKQGQYSPDNIKKREIQEEMERKLAENTTVGSRCRVSMQNGPIKIGTVMYAGLVDGLAGYWIGVKYDEPLGKNDGSLKGKRYFDCPDKYGAFVKPANVECGDFPEDNYNLDEEI